jgi:hypothetical protein
MLGLRTPTLEHSVFIRRLHDTLNQYVYKRKKIMLKIFLVVFMAFITFSCSSVIYNYNPIPTSFSIPEIDKEITKGIGEPLLDQGKQTLIDVLYIRSDAGLALYRVKPGKLIKIGDDEDTEYYSQDVSTIIFASISYPAPSAKVMRNKFTGKYCIVRPGDIDICGVLDAERGQENLITRDSFRRTLIYSGRVGNKLKISYREFSENMARPAFSTDAEYDLNEGNIIGYAGARLEVIKATNTEITYKVIKNFNSP